MKRQKEESCSSDSDNEEIIIKNDKPGFVENSNNSQKSVICKSVIKLNILTNKKLKISDKEGKINEVRQKTSGIFKKPSLENRRNFTKKIDISDTKPKKIRRKRSEITAEYFCDICQKGFTRKFDMKKHRLNTHKDAPEPTDHKTKENVKRSELLNRCRITSEDKEAYKCELCNKVITHSDNFIRHQSIHTGIKEYFCHMCAKKFRTKNGLNRHIKEFHCRIKNYACDICKRKFATKSTLNEHKNLHTNERPFVCDICGKAFKQKASLHVHKIFHTDNFRFNCTVCGKKYRRARDLKVHSWLHTGHRPYSCDKCGYMFRLSQDLKRHSKTHNKISEHICGDCGASFAQERFLNNHKKIHLNVKKTTT